MTWNMYEGDCLDVMAGFEDCSVDTIITDPLYGLSFMGKDWDHGVPGIPFWAEALRVTKPGAMLLAFGGTRTFHRLTCAIEDAGWEIRDCIMWVYAQGFPKGHDIHKNMVAKTCNCKGSAVSYIHNEIHTEPSSQHDMRSLRQTDIPQTVNATDERGQVLQPFMPEQSPQGDGQESRQGIEGRQESSLEGWGNVLQEEGQLQEHPILESARMGQADGASGWIYNGASARDGTEDWAATHTNGSGASSEPRSSGQRSVEPGIVAKQQQPQEGRGGELCHRCGKYLVSPQVVESWRGWNVALKPAWEPIIVAMKPIDQTYARNAVMHGVAGLWVDGARAGTNGGTHKHDAPKGNSNGVYGNGLNGGGGTGREINAGRWPANVILDDSDEVRRLFPVTTSGGGNKSRKDNTNHTVVYGKYNLPSPDIREIDTGSAARFFYTAKASRSERNAGLDGDANNHPTVKPLALMRYLARLTRTPTGGVVLDPFAGSGTTGVACLLEGRGFVGIERLSDYVMVAQRRIAYYEQQVKLKSIQLELFD